MSDALDLKLEKLRGEVASQNTAMQMGFSEIHKSLDAIFAQLKDGTGHCRTCETTLRKDIKDTEQLARDLVTGVTKEVLIVVDKGHTDHETRIRSVERGYWKWAGAFGVLGGFVVMALRWAFSKWG